MPIGGAFDFNGAENFATVRKLAPVSSRKARLHTDTKPHKNSPSLVATGYFTYLSCPIT